MTKTKLILPFSVLLLAALACNFVAPTASPTTLPPTVIPEFTVIVEPTSSVPQQNVPGSEAEVERIPVELALTALQSGAAVIVDVRSPQAYEAKHIAGAISIPLGEIETNLESLKLEKDQWIITYCT